MTTNDLKALGYEIINGKAVRVAKKEIKTTDKPKRSKYGNTKTEVEGIKFDSAKEAKRYQDLKIESFARTISDLKLQPVYPIEINGVLVCKYKGDFEYIRNGVKILEDVKGMKTPIYRLKKKLVKAVYGIEILES